MPTIQEEITRVRELIFGNVTKEPIEEGCGDEVIIKEPNHTDKHHKGSYMAKQQLYNIMECKLNNIIFPAMNNPLHNFKSN